MRMLIAAVLLLVCGIGLVAHVSGELPADPRESATYVVAGKVTKVFARDNDGFTDFVVQIRIDDVEKGEGYRSGDFIYAYAFKRKPGGATNEPGIGGHRQIPEEGQHIKAWIKHAKGQMRALYPRWFEVLPTPEKSDAGG
jgi:hypothetical protein